MTRLLEKRKKKWHDLINSLSEGSVSVQNIVVISLLALIAFLIDGAAYVYYSSRIIAFVRILLCVAVVYNWPLPAIYLISSVIIATVSYQAGGYELLLAGCIMALLQYAKVRMVNTEFSRGVLIAGGYILFEGASYVAIKGVSGTEVVVHLVVVGILFLLYTLYEG